MKTICVLVGALLLAGSCSSLSLVPRITFSFVVDVTGSMSREINFVRQAIYNFTFHLSHLKSLGIDHFILSTFSDPVSLNRVYEYPDIAGLHKGVSALKGTGGGDCPEYGFDGLFGAVNKSLPNSYIFYFSDASVKDYHVEWPLINAAKAKNIRIWLITTGCCSSTSCAANAPYRKVATNTGGVLYSVKEDDIPLIMRFVNQNLRCGIAAFHWMKNPPKTLDELRKWFLVHRTCSLPGPIPPPVPTLPPVGGASTLSVSVFSVMMAVVASLLSF